MGIADVLKDINSKAGEDIIGFGVIRPKTDKIPFSSPRLNYLTRGGMPRGYIVEFFGEESAGKSSLCLDIAANAQALFQHEWEVEIAELKEIKKLNKTQEARLKLLENRGPLKAVFLDCENTLDEEWATKIGVDCDKLLVLKPIGQTAEFIFQCTLDLIKTGEIGLIILDSIAVLISAQAFKKTQEESTMGGIAKPLANFSNEASQFCRKHNVLLIGTNQLRDNFNSQHGGTTTPGGRGWKHNCAFRLAIRKGVFLDEFSNDLPQNKAVAPCGNIVEVAVAKNKLTKPDRRMTSCIINYSVGFDIIVDTIIMGEQFGVISKSGAWYEVVDKETGEIIAKTQGRPALIKFFEENQEEFEKVYKLVVANF